MAAPATALRLSFRFRDAKGNTGRMRFLIGDATQAAILTDAATLIGHVRAISNAEVSLVEAGGKDLAYGTQAVFGSVEDKARCTFYDSNFNLHHFEVPCPKSAIFMADGETVDPANADVIAFAGDMHTFVYSDVNDTAPLTFVGGVRTRRKMHRRLNIFVKNPAETGPGE
jgi:hypothetical protein